MSETSGFIVQALRLGISGSAGLHNASPYMVKSRVPLRFDFDKPAVYMVNPRRDRPTYFVSEKEAREKTDNVVARVRALLRIQDRTGKQADIGQATMLLPRDFGSGEIGGYEVVDAALFQAELGEEQKLLELEDREKVAQADSEARAAQERADKVREELGAVKVAAPSTSSDTSGWVATDIPRVQTYRRQDGVQTWRGRKDGKVSPGYPTSEEAVRWLDGDRAEKPSDDRAEAMKALEGKMVRT